MLPSDLDVVWTTENYHDLHNDLFGKPDMKAFDTAVFNALKPGGEYIIEDHVAKAGSGASDTDTLHRIDPALVKQEAKAAGFVYVGESQVLHNPEDTHTAKVFTHGRQDRPLPVQVQEAARLRPQVVCARDVERRAALRACGIGAAGR